MIDPRQVAIQILGPIDWQTEVSGFCRCPGEAMHTSRNGEKDCRVNIDGAPTIFCFHSSCIEAVSEANLRLRQALAGGDWTITLPSGQVLRSGEVLVSGEVRSQKSEVRNSTDARERVVLEAVQARAGEFKAELLERFYWPMDQIIADSPLQVSGRDPEDQFRTWLKIWPAHCTVWIGDVFSSGKPEHRTHFRSLADWYQIGPVMGNFTCGAAFKPGSFQRSNENLDGHRFLVVESDTLSKDQVGAVFAYMQRRLRYRLHCIIDTAGKSLHAWFDAPRNKIFETRLKAGLTAFGCDPKMFTYSQPVRVPGAFREGKLQNIVWLRQ